MTARTSLISELEESIRNGSRDDRVRSLRRVTDLFLTTSDRLNDEQIGVFEGLDHGSFHTFLCGGRVGASKNLCRAAVVPDNSRLDRGLGRFERSFYLSRGCVRAKIAMGIRCRYPALTRK